MNFEILKDRARRSLQRVAYQERQADIRCFLMEAYITPSRRKKKKEPKSDETSKSTNEFTGNTEGQRSMLNHNSAKPNMWENIGQTAQFLQR